MRWISGILALVITISTVEISIGFEWLKDQSCSIECHESMSDHSSEPEDCSDPNCDPFLCCSTVWFSIHDAKEWNFHIAPRLSNAPTIYYLPQFNDLDFEIWQPPKI